MFTKDAADAVYRYSGGTPRLINLLCESVMVYGYAEGATRLPAQLVEDVARERQANGLLPRILGSQIDVATAMPAHTAVNIPAPVEPVSKRATASQGPIMPQPKPVEPGVSAQHGSASSQDDATDIIEAAGQENPHIDIDVDIEIEETIPAAIQLAAGGPARAGVISKLIRLDSWPRATSVNSEQVGRHVTRTRVSPAAPDTIKTSRPDFGSEPRLVVPAADAGAVPAHAITPVPRRAMHISNSESVSTMNRGQDMRAADNGSRNQQTGNSSRWVVAGSVGFSIGLLGAVVAFSLAYFKYGVNLPTPQVPMSVVMPPAALLSPGVPDAAASASPESAVPTSQPMLEALQRERDAAIAQTKAMERERDAALAAAQAREQANAAALSAARARAREKAATLEALKAQEMARTAELEAIAVRERERAATIEAANVQLRKSQAETKPDADAGVPAAKAADAEPRAEPATAAKATPPSAAAESPVKFSANPCKGPSAKFLSTCKE